MKNFELDEDSIAKLIDRPIAFQSSFARVAGSVTAGLFLSQAFYWTKIKIERMKETDGWFYKTAKEWEEETTLSRREQETARKRLGQLGIIDEKKVGIPRKLYFRINRTRLIELLLNKEKEGRTYKNGGFVQTGFDKSANPFSTKPPRFSRDHSRDYHKKIKISSPQENGDPIGDDFEKEELFTLKNPEPTPGTRVSRQRKPGKPSGSTQEFIAFYSKKFSDKFLKPPRIIWGKDGDLVKQLLNTYSLEDLKRYVTAFLYTDDDDFIKNSGFTIGVFSTQVNKFIVSEVPQPKKSGHDRLVM